jgi:hypothetical protein
MGFRSALSPFSSATATELRQARPKRVITMTFSTGILSVSALPFRTREFGLFTRRKLTKISYRENSAGYHTKHRTNAHHLRSKV